MALTAKQERFAQNIALKNMSQVAAYSEAYDTAKMSPGAIAEEAKRLAAHPLVIPRVDVLREGATRSATKTAAYTRDVAMARAENAELAALANGQASAAVAAIKLQAELAGHLTEKKADAKGTLDDMDVVSLIKLKAAVEDSIDRSREALAMTDTPTTQAAPPQLRRVI